MSAADSGAAPVATVDVAADRVAVGGRLDFTTAGDVLARVAPAIRATRAVTVDMAGVTTSNSAGLALVIEWLAIARRSGHQLRLANVPDGLGQLARVCQVDTLLSDASA